MTKLTRAGVTLHYEVHGDAGPVILLSHGYSATAQMWRGQIETLSRSYRLVLWDMRGHGQSDYPLEQSAYSEGETVADMAAILDAVGADKAIVGGLSLGGYMSLSFYATHPARVSALLIIDTGPGFKKDETREAWNVNARKTAQRYADKGLNPNVGEERHRNAEGLVLAGRGLLTQADARVMNVLPEITVPSLIIVGADDAPFLNAANYMEAKINGARKVVIPDAGHVANIDQPQAFNAALGDFLASL
ncbi:MAG: alpha/beta fold hydrolase [Parvibaculaceae bacterium]